MVYEKHLDATDNRKRPERGNGGTMPWKIAVFIFLATLVNDSHAQGINTRAECLAYVRKDKPICNRAITPYEVCICGTDEQDFQENIRTTPVQIPPPLDWSRCVKDEETGILYCPNDIFPEQS